MFDRVLLIVDQMSKRRKDFQGNELFGIIYEYFTTYVWDVRGRRGHRGPAAAYHVGTVSENRA